MRKRLMALVAIPAVIAIMMAGTGPVGAATLSSNFRDINSPPNSCAFSTAILTTQLNGSNIWTQQMTAAVQWFGSDPGCNYLGGPIINQPSGTLRISFELECSINGGSSFYFGYGSPTVYNTGNSGQVAVTGNPPSFQNWCGTSANQAVIARIHVFAGYFEFGAWFNTQHTQAWVAG